MTEAWAQCAVRFASLSITIKQPVKNVIRIEKIATGSGTFSATVDGTNVPAFGVAAEGRRTPFHIAEDIAVGINAVIGPEKAFAFNSHPKGNVAHVVVNKGISTSLAVVDNVPNTDISVPQFSISDSAVDWNDEEPCLAANFGDGNPNTLDFFVVKTLASKARGDAWSPVYCGPDSDMRNTSFIVLTAADTAPDDPHTAAHEAGRFILNTEDLHPGPYNLMNMTSIFDTVNARKRLTSSQHFASRSVSDGTILQAK
jgi:hypothetical protein